MKKILSFFINSSKVRDWIIILLIAGIASFVAFFLITSIMIRISTQETCNYARNKYEKVSCVDAVLAELEDTSVSMEERNHDIWALGQIGDRKALPILEKYHQDADPECDRSQELCQYEIEKAIDLIESGRNITKYFWFEIQ